MISCSPDNSFWYKYTDHKKVICGEEKERTEGENYVHENDQVYVTALKWERHAEMPELGIVLTVWFHSQKLLGHFSQSDKILE